MSAKKTTLRILSSLKSIIDDDFSCPICSEPCTDTLVNPACGHRFCGKCIKAKEGEGNCDCPTCGVQIAAFQSCRADLQFDRILEKVVTELVLPLLDVEENLSTNDNRPQKDQTVGSTVKLVVDHALDEVCAQNQVIVVAGSRKRHRSSQEQQFLSTTTATNEETMYKNSGNDVIVEQGRKTLKTNEVSCRATVPCLAELRSQHKYPNLIITRSDKSVRDSSSSSQVRSSHTRRKGSTESCEKTEIEATINSSKKVPERNEPYSGELPTALEQHEQSPSKSSNHSVTARNISNPSHASFVATQNTPAWIFESPSGLSPKQNLKIIEHLKDTTPLFQNRIEELMKFKAKFGHCNASTSNSASNKPYLSLGRWCHKLRQNYKKPAQGKLLKAQIEILDAIGFQWELQSPFDKRIEELMAFKAKFGHCNVTLSRCASNKPYTSLAYWCGKVRQSQKKPSDMKLSKAQIERLDAVGFQWELQSPVDKHIEELRAFKAKYGHCNVTTSKSTSNKPCLVLGRWCCQVRHSRKLTEEGNNTELKLTKAQIKSLDDLGFQWELQSPFDKRMEELRAFDAKFGHCMVSQSRSVSNKPYLSLSYWCSKVRKSRKLIIEGKTGKALKLSLAQIESLDAIGFPWEL